MLYLRISREPLNAVLVVQKWLTLITPSCKATYTFAFFKQKVQCCDRMAPFTHFVRSGACQSPLRSSGKRIQRQSLCLGVKMWRSDIGSQRDIADGRATAEVQCRNIWLSEQCYRQKRLFRPFDN